MISENFCKKLNLSLIPTNLALSGINQVVSVITKKCQISLLSKFNSFNITSIFYVVPVISNQIPSASFDISSFVIPSNIQLSDPLFNESTNVDANLFWDLLINGKIKLVKGLPNLQNTRLGWIVNGVVPYETTRVSCNFTRAIAEDDQLKHFWEMGEMQDSIPCSKDDDKYEEICQKSTARYASSQFKVKLPLTFPADLLGDSMDTEPAVFLILLISLFTLITMIFPIILLILETLRVPKLLEFN
ncbi:uncharacterized protein LOC126883729 [Diabrotica virgifera virgifera]|uniref:Peptidase aspartic putative domain-containing protein n=1 Tax=Diabrotica virgifera virgifera TaxID=50390 RepID=A0ABM5K588_DIAVI|nr:uncharacterized protein LOC126883729 [Diabrotica virgifera virgifera]